MRAYSMASDFSRQSSVAHIEPKQYQIASKPRMYRRAFNSFAILKIASNHVQKSHSFSLSLLCFAWPRSARAEDAFHIHRPLNQRLERPRPQKAQWSAGEGLWRMRFNRTCRLDKKCAWTRSWFRAVSICWVCFIFCFKDGCSLLSTWSVIYCKSYLADLYLDLCEVIYIYIYICETLDDMSWDSGVMSDLH